jgi:hypothetical protein
MMRVFTSFKMVGQGDRDTITLVGHFPEIARFLPLKWGISIQQSGP